MLLRFIRFMTRFTRRRDHEVHNGQSRRCNDRRSPSCGNRLLPIHSDLSFILPTTAIIHNSHLTEHNTQIRISYRYARRSLGGVSSYKWSTVIVFARMPGFFGRLFAPILVSILVSIHVPAQKSRGTEDAVIRDRLPYFSIPGRIKDVWTISTVSDTQDHWTIYNQASNRSYVGTRVRNGDRLHRRNVGIVKLSKAVHFLSFADRKRGRATLHCNILAVRCI